MIKLTYVLIQVQSFWLRLRRPLKCIRPTNKPSMNSTTHFHWLLLRSGISLYSTGIWTRPSQIPMKNQMKVSQTYIPGLADKEQCLHLGQADDALNELRISSSVLVFKQGQHSASQQLSQSTQGLMDRFYDKMNLCTECYSSAFTALSHLDPAGDWTICLCKLNHLKDLQLPHREDLKDLKKKKRERQAGENRHQLSWIWLVLRVGGPSKDVVTADKINDSEFTVVSHLQCTLADFIYSCSSLRHVC